MIPPPLKIPVKKELGEIMRKLKQKFDDVEIIPELSNMKDERFIFTALKDGKKILIKVSDEMSIHKELRMWLAIKEIVPTLEMTKIDDPSGFYSDFCENGDLQQFMEKDCHKEIIVYFFEQILKIILNLHTRNYYHRDLKPENFLVDDDKKLVLIDFEYVKYENSCGGNIGTRVYKSPEIGSGRYDCEKADIYAVGKILDFLLQCSGKTDKEINEFIEEIDMCNEDISKRPKLSDDTIRRLIVQLKEFLWIEHDEKENEIPKKPKYIFKSLKKSKPKKSKSKSKTKSKKSKSKSKKLILKSRTK